MGDSYDPVLPDRAVPVVELGHPAFASKDQVKTLVQECVREEVADTVLSTGSFGAQLLGMLLVALLLYRKAATFVRSVRAERSGNTSPD
jgi:hypothetical protein